MDLAPFFEDKFQERFLSLRNSKRWVDFIGFEEESEGKNLKQSEGKNLKQIIEENARVKKEGQTSN